MENGDQVTVNLQQGDPHMGVVIDVRTHGLTIDDDTDGLIFVPWSAVAFVELVTANAELRREEAEAQS